MGLKKISPKKKRRFFMGMEVFTFCFSPSLVIVTFVLRIFNNLKVPSELKVGSDYHLFQAGIEPEWEHPKHLGGGAWTFRTHAKDPPAQIDYVWFQVVTYIYIFAL
jgi:hypothetical protein